MSNKEVDKLIDRIPKKNKYMVTTEEVVNYIFILENRIDKVIEYINNGSYFDGSLMCKNDLLNILRGEDK